MDIEMLQRRKDQLYGFMQTAGELAKLLDVMQISGTRADMRKMEALIAKIKGMQ